MCKTRHSNKLVPIFVCVLTYFLQSCATHNALYSWQDYESVTISAMNAGEKHRAKRISRYQKLIDGQKKGFRKVPPPGIFLEYGYELAMSGKLEKGIENGFTPQQSTILIFQAIKLSSVLLITLTT